jgi:hypothetical protein
MGGSKKFIGLVAMGAAVIGMSSVAVAGKGGGGGGGGGNVSGVISVPDALYAGTTTATVNPGGTDVYVYVQCYTPDFGGDYVYAAFFPVDANNQAELGPLWSTLWPQGSASCQAQEGYFTRNGFGKWVDVATTTFRVNG